MWFAGIDWADRQHEVVVLNEQGHQVGALRVQHSAAGLEQLTSFLRGFTATEPERSLGPESGEGLQLPRQVAGVVETNHGLLIAALLEAGLAVYPVNPPTIGHSRPPSGVKTDALDAFLLARKGRSEWPDLRVLQPAGPVVQELKTLTRDLESLLREQTRLVNQVTACLKAYSPAALACFDGLARQVSLAFLPAFPTPEQAQHAGVERLTELLASVHSPRARRKAEQLVQLFAAPRLQAPAGVARAKARLLQALVAQLQVVTEHVTAFDRAIQQLFAQHADAALFVSLPGAGKRLAPRLLAEWGDDRARYASAASLQALAGTAPVVYRSGAFRGVRRRVACVNALRQALYHCARESVLCEDWAAAYYKRKRQQGKTHAMALRARANQWVRIIHAIWVTRQPYDAATFAAAQLAHTPHPPHAA
jgi:transposase